METADAATVSALAAQVKVQQDALMRLIASTEQSLADVVQALQQRPSSAQADALQAIAAQMELALAELVGQSEQSRISKALEALAMAIVSMPAPQVHVSASPALVQVNVPPAPAPIALSGPARWRVTIPGQHGAPDRLMLIERSS